MVTYFVINQVKLQKKFTVIILHFSLYGKKAVVTFTCIHLKEEDTFTNEDYKKSINSEEHESACHNFNELF